MAILMPLGVMVHHLLVVVEIRMPQGVIAQHLRRHQQQHLQVDHKAVAQEDLLVEVMFIVQQTR